MAGVALGGKDMSVALMVVMISWVYTSTWPQTPRVVYIKYVQLFTCRSSFNKVA